ncbi:hypothetical protein QYF61_024311 [Mycteria americana]|uniref:Uncharacterized protein n=1 Tax=Mycteria americana TaxID=33587 RepID=A0AAN7MMC9_MYCAM|nr:hypothetical protein QYF61_024311 [Mycteria americana]
MGSQVLPGACSSTDAMQLLSTLTDAQPVLKQRLRSPQPTSPVFLFSMTSYGMEYPFHQFGSAVLVVSPPSFLCTSSLLAGRADGDLDRLEHWAIISGMKFNKSKCWILHLGRSNAGHKYKLGEE